MRRRSEPRLLLCELRLLQPGHRRLCLLETREGRQTAAGQRPSESERVVGHGDFPPGVDGEAGHADHVAARFARQTAAMFEPFGDATRSGIVSGGHEAEIAEFEPQLV